MNRKVFFLRVASVVFLIAAVSLFHYLTSTEFHTHHNVYRRMYYIPIIVSAFFFGLRGGLVSSAIVSLIYIPHAFLLKHHLDPASHLDKVMEIILYNAVGAITGLLVMRERKLNERLKQSMEEQSETEKKLQTAQHFASLGHLTSGIAHEIRNPLGAIRGVLDILSNDYPEGTKKRELLEIAVCESDRLNAKLKELLEYAKPSEPQKIRIPIGELSKRACSLLEQEFEKRGVSLGYCDSGGETEVFCDPEQIHQVIINILLNALQAVGENGKVSVSHAVNSIKGEDLSDIRISDDGPGIPAAVMPKIFEPYFSTRKEGTGLGLALAQRIVHNNGGFIEVESIEGKGSLFIVSLRKYLQSRNQ